MLNFYSFLERFPKREPFLIDANYDEFEVSQKKGILLTKAICEGCSTRVIIIRGVHSAMKIPSFAIFKSSGIIRNVKWSFDFKEEGEFPEVIEFIEVIAVVEDKKFPPAKYETCRDCIKRVEKSDMLKLLRL